MRFGTDGVRGRANDELTAEFALRLGRAAAHVLGAERVVVGGDSRISTPMVEAALVAGFASAGVEVHRLGVAPTPTVAFVASELNAMGAVVSASHNPYHDNGIKLFDVGGTKLADDVESGIEAELATLGPASGDVGRVTHRSDATAGYLAHLTDVLQGRNLAGMKIVVDAANGAAAGLVERVFTATGADVTVINDRPDGVNINAGCGATDTTTLQAIVVAESADVGIALDGDADRLIAVDGRGQVVNGDKIIALCAADLQDRGLLAHDTVAVTVMTNLGFRLAMEARGITVVETAVGDRNILAALTEGGFSLGGEQSGHIIFSDWASTGDGMLSALVLLDAVQRSGQSLADLADAAMTSLPQVLINVAVHTRRPDIAQLVAPEIAAAHGVLGDTGRVLIRASGTEPLIRIMVEAKRDDIARSVAESLVDPVKRVCSN